MTSRANILIGYEVIEQDTNSVVCDDKIVQRSTTWVHLVAFSDADRLSQWINDLPHEVRGYLRVRTAIDVDKLSALCSDLNSREIDDAIGAIINKQKLSHEVES